MANIPTIEFGVPGDKVKVPRIGLGCMGFSPIYGEVDDQESLQTINHALDVGCSFLDTADVYGLGGNEKLLSNVLKDRRDDVFLCTKFGNAWRDPEPGFQGGFADLLVGVKGDSEYVRKSFQNSLDRLGVDRIDLYYQHRVDTSVPIEETVGAMAELVKAGKVRYLGLSECSAETLRRAYKVHPIAAVQVEYNCWSLDIEQNGLLEACRELGVTVVAYSPLGRGFMTGQIRSFDDLPENDFRRGNPRFQPENFHANIKLVEAFEEMSAKKGASLGSWRWRGCWLRTGT
ncbi:aryl alcohol dehydrogenase [Linderina pennispora]|uniref:Aryl alcohol dehydrogenase n=1 Tax=Linderina pennispora TaxID=61395 RepID=A0A1Y1WHS9_9FUNG|nr:aryl alcohol dehydrogenase [Linderina pennispora]ORX73067.1 aryl alcohol dehydrogenase [Linderina pennispora]